jgi:hypothetical protein
VGGLLLLLLAVRQSYRWPSFDQGSSTAACELVEAIANQTSTAVANVSFNIEKKQGVARRSPSSITEWLPDTTSMPQRIPVTVWKR